MFLITDFHSQMHLDFDERSDMNILAKTNKQQTKI